MMVPGGGMMAIATRLAGWDVPVASHAVPRLSSLALPRGPALSAVSGVIAGGAEAHRCREKLIVPVGNEDPAACRPGPCASGDGQSGEKPARESSTGAGRE